MVVNKKTVLLVDDEFDLLDCYHDVFTSDQIEVHTAENGLKALELIQKNKYDCIVTDLNMPHIHGVQLIACIKASENNKYAAILVISSNLHNENLQKLEALKVVETLPKPVQPDDMKLKVEKMIYPDRREAVAYNPKYINIFKDSVCKIMTFYFGEEPEYQEPYIQRKSDPYGLATGVVNFFGPEFFGVMSISCDEQFISELASRLFEMDPNDVDADQFKDLVGEMANQIGGAVKALTAENSLDVILGIPFMLMSSEHKVPACVSSPKIAILFSVGKGNCRLEFALGDPQNLLLNKNRETADIFIYKNEDKNVA